MTVTFDLQAEIYRQQEALEKRIEYLRQSHETTVKKIERTVLFMQEATGEGLVLSVKNDLSAPIWEVPIDRGEDWRTLHRLLGDFENDFVEPISNDARKKDIWVYMKPVNADYKHIRIKYKSKLTKGQKCKIKRQKSSYISVVCDT